MFLSSSLCLPQSKLFFSNDRCNLRKEKLCFANNDKDERPQIFRLVPDEEITEEYSMFEDKVDWPEIQSGERKSAEMHTRLIIDVVDEDDEDVTLSTTTQVFCKKVHPASYSSSIYKGFFQAS